MLSAGSGGGDRPIVGTVLFRTLRYVHRDQAFYTPGMIRSIARCFRSS
jgi:hypothetical protein